MKLRALIFISFILLMRPCAHSQDSVRCGSWVSINTHYGFIVPLYQSSMAYLIRAHVPGIEVDYLTKTPISKPWQQAYHCPETGIAFFYGWLGNPAELGNMIGVYPFVNFHLQRSYREKFYLRIGIGLAYLPVTYDRVTNHKDNVIGSHINAMINIRLTHHFYLSRNFRIETGFGVTHCSNGSFKTPNLGINLLSANTGISYCLHPYQKYISHPYSDSTPCRKFEHECIVGMGLSQIEPPGGQKYFATTLNYTAYHVLNQKNKIGGGIDFFYNNANIANLQEGNISIPPLQNVQIGLKGSYEIVIGKIALPLELGGYAYTKYTGRGYEYNRIGIRYYANPHFIVNLTLLTHFASADYIEWGAGYIF